MITAYIIYLFPLYIDHIDANRNVGCFCRHIICDKVGAPKRIIVQAIRRSPRPLQGVQRIYNRSCHLCYTTSQCSITATTRSALHTTPPPPPKTTQPRHLREYRYARSRLSRETLLRYKSMHFVVR